MKSFDLVVIFCYDNYALAGVNDAYRFRHILEFVLPAAKPPARDFLSGAHRVTGGHSHTQTTSASGGIQVSEKWRAHETTRMLQLWARSSPLVKTLKIARASLEGLHQGTCSRCPVALSLLSCNFPLAR